MFRLVAASVLTAIMAMPARAELQTVTLAVPGMTCPACPVTVSKALSRVPGVSSVTVIFEKRQATVEFDDTRTSIVALLRATGAAGYPSTELETR